MSRFCLKQSLFTTILVVFAVALAIYYPFSEFLMFAFLGSFIIYLTSRPSRAELAGSLGIAIMLVVSARLGRGVLPNALWVAALFPGLAGITMLGLRMTWCDTHRRQDAAASFRLAVLIPSSLFAAAAALQETIKVLPLSYDSVLYRMDSAFGFQPSFLMGRLFAEHYWLARVSAFAYYALPLGFCVLIAAESNNGRTALLLKSSSIAVVVAFVMYHLVPAAGPTYVFAGFPWVQPHPLAGGPALLKQAVPRNCVPSMHVTWALLMWWNSHRLWTRIWSGAFLVFTIVATLGLGQHYGVDLVVAVPFAFALQKWCSGHWQENRTQLAITAGVVLMWLALMRRGIVPPTPVMWFLALGTIVYVALAPTSLLRGNVGGRSRSHEANACIAEPAEVI